MEISNKEVMDKLVEHFLKHDPKKIARLCASFLLDINRIGAADQLTKEERRELKERMEFNLSQLYLFLESDNKDMDLTVLKWTEFDGKADS
jgi:hypothetical protein